MRYYLGLDNGGTTTKAALFSEDGKEVAVSRVDTAMITPKADFIERDMEEMWQANCTVTKDVIAKAKIAADDIAGVGICGHGKGLYLWGKDDKPVRNGIISTDNRAYMYAEKWKTDGTEARAFDISLQHVMACQPVPLLAWLRDNEPDSYKNIRWIFECKDYVRFRLTGEARAELTDYSGSGFLNLNTRQYDEKLLELFGLEQIKDALPPLCNSTDIVGKVTDVAAAQCGLKAGTPVIGGMFDIDACAIAAGVTDESKICVIAGTWSINEYLRKAPVTDKSVRMNSLFCLPEYYLIEESSATSAGNLEWLIREMLKEKKKSSKSRGENFYKELDDDISKIPAIEPLPVFLPFLMGTNTHPNAKASFVGITANHTRAHIARAVYEGIVFCHKVHVEKLLASRQTPPECIRLAGGAANSEVWTQMFADVLNLPVERVTANETGALGCAIAIATAVGDAATLADAAKKMCRISNVVYPNPDAVKAYEKKFVLYEKTVACLNDIWDYMKT